jgi:peptidoglycan-associated lipoprotein
MRKHNWALTIAVIGLALVLTASTGCKRKRDRGLTSDMTQTDTSTVTTPGGATGSGQPAVDLENMLFDRATGLQTIYFDYDSSALREDARAALAANAEKINQVPGVLIQCAGHCDERGTQEYNLALGERRALAVRDYLISLGVPAERLVTISYGEEMPAVPGSNESAWAQNRRVEFNRAQ